MYICVNIYTFCINFLKAIANINKTFYAKQNYCGEVGKNDKMIPLSNVTFVYFIQNYLG